MSKRDGARSAARCLGAQYVASLDPSISGMLADMPRVGAAMLFARVDERGRVSLVRTGVVTEFGRHRDDDDNPFVEQETVTSRSVETSAPVLPPSFRDSHPSLEHDPYEDDGADEHTRPIDTYAPSHASGRHLPELIDEETVDEDLQRTAEYEARGSRRLANRDDERPVLSSQPATLRKVPKLPSVAARGRRDR